MEEFLSNLQRGRLVDWGAFLLLLGGAVLLACHTGTCEKVAAWCQCMWHPTTGGEG